MNLKTSILTENDCYRAGKKIKPVGVMWHSTGANNPSLRRYVQPDDGLLGKNLYENDWNRPGLKVCVHAFIGKLADGSIATYQTLPWDHRGWHCGAEGNNTHISFEICEDALEDAAYFRKVCREGIELTAMLCKQFDLDPMKAGVVIDHAEGYRRGIASNHGDISHWLKKYAMTMEDIRRSVQREMEKERPEEVKSVRYETLRDLKADENNAPYYVPTVEKLLRSGVLQGRGGEGESLILDLSEDAVRLLVILDRQGIFG